MAEIPFSFLKCFFSAFVHILITKAEASVWCYYCKIPDTVSVPISYVEESADNLNIYIL